MLTSEEMEQINYAGSLLTAIKMHELNSENTDLYDKTGITLANIDKSIQALNKIYITQFLKKEEQKRKRGCKNNGRKEK